jgi:anti-sigma regulatory factor (Ser/Thr protein kinase)
LVARPVELRYLNRLATKRAPNTKGYLSSAGLFVHPYIAVLVTGAMLALFTWGINLIHTLLPGTEPDAILYLIPVTFGGALLGLRGGYLTSIIALCLNLFAVDHTPATPAFLGRPEQALEFFTLLLSMFIVASVTGCLHSAFRDLQHLNGSLIESEERRLGFNREVLLAVTSGRLVLCDESELRGMVATEPVFTMALREPRDVGEFRRHLREAVLQRDVMHIQLDELEVCATEAATNAIKHGNGGTAEVRVSDAEVSLLIADHGTGIAPTDLARATLERGFSTRVSLGMGFTMMLETADVLALSTSPGGTIVLLRSFNAPRTKNEETLLARYAPIEEWVPEGG